ncbi:unnamed protein product [marine sediment metagenome]|uniref:Uncharacterized protein n=1 Tax=marine sediment metagenome TaxID=412755 RepID=X0Y9W8_9ZZZZ
MTFIKDCDTMSSRCRICIEEMPKDRKGWEQVCPVCREIGYKELLDPSYDYDIERKLKGNENNK